MITSTEQPDSNTIDAQSTAVPALTDYEQQQIRAIAGWKAEAPGLFTEIFDILAHPVVSVAERLIPEHLLREAVKMSYDASEVFAHRAEILERAGVSCVEELRNKDLEFCDALAMEFGRKAGGSAMMTSASIAATGGASVFVTVPMMMTYSLKTIHTISFCYGFATHKNHEREYALNVLHVASVGSLKDKLAALEQLRTQEDCMHRSANDIAGEAIESVIEGAAEHSAEEALEAAIEGAVRNSAESAAEEVVSEQIVTTGALRAMPLIGIAFGAVSDAAMASHVANVATYCFRERWLRTNRGVAAIEPDAKLARGVVRRLEGSVGRAIYWTFFTASFAASFPPILLASFIPRKSSVAEGCAAGRDAARRDLASLLRQPAVAPAAPRLPAPRLSTT